LEYLQGKTEHELVDRISLGLCDFYNLLFYYQRWFN
jgi:hypothetical protein